MAINPKTILIAKVIEVWFFLNLNIKKIKIQNQILRAVSIIKPIRSAGLPNIR
ncbi:MAG: hypothetical protein ACYDIA_10305 [Candidatus Humimicrobiaceae bacterium]